MICNKHKQGDSNNNLIPNKTKSIALERVPETHRYEQQHQQQQKHYHNQQLLLLTEGGGEQQLSTAQSATLSLGYQHHQAVSLIAFNIIMLPASYRLNACFAAIAALVAVGSSSSSSSSSMFASAALELTVADCSDLASLPSDLMSDDVNLFLDDAIAFTCDEVSKQAVLGAVCRIVCPIPY